jgi:hypothetical protein
MQETLAQLAFLAIMQQNGVVCTTPYTAAKKLI